MSSDHHHHPPTTGRGRLLAAAALNSGFAVVQVLVGLAIGSVVVLADAAHQVVDAIGLLTALAAVILATRPSSSTMSFGWGKSDALGGLLSGMLLLASVAWIAYESILRLLDPVEVEGGGVIVIGLIAVAVNGISVLALGGHDHPTDHSHPTDSHPDAHDHPTDHSHPDHSHPDAGPVLESLTTTPPVLETLTTESDAEALENGRGGAEALGNGRGAGGSGAEALEKAAAQQAGNEAAHLSLRAARLHLLTDLAGSALVVLAGVLLQGTTWTWIDPVASLLLCLAVLRANVGLLRSASFELLDRVPKGITPADVDRVLREQPGVEGVHHVHIRPLGQQRTSVTAHVVVDGEQTLHDAQLQIAQLTTVLEADLEVAHATLQLECHPCPEPDC